MFNNNYDKNNVIVYGAGVYGEIALHGLRMIGVEPRYFVDRKLAGHELEDVCILAPDVNNLPLDAYYLVAVGSPYHEVVDFLKNLGCIHIENLSEILSMPLDAEKLSSKAEYYWTNKHLYYAFIHTKVDNEIYLHNLDFVTTEKCSLRCKDCSNLIPYYKRPINIDMDESIEALDRFFDAIDYLSEIRVLGGETFVIKNTYKVLEYIAEQKKCGQAVVYTNGTILPDDRTMDDLSDGLGIVHISDYGVNHERILRNVEVFRSHGVKCYVRSDSEWLDLGDVSDRHYKKEKMQEVYDRCSWRECYQFHGTRFYSCARIGGMHHSGILPVSENWKDEYVDFSNKEKDTCEYRKLLLRQIERKVPFRACGYCNGFFDAKGIPAGVQSGSEGIR